MSKTAKPTKANDLTRRESIIQEATKLFAEHGYHAVGMRSIANAVGIQGSCCRTRLMMMAASRTVMT